VMMADLKQLDPCITLSNCTKTQADSYLRAEGVLGIMEPTPDMVTKPAPRTVASPRQPTLSPNQKAFLNDVGGGAAADGPRKRRRMSKAPFVTLFLIALVCTVNCDASGLLPRVVRVISSQNAKLIAIVCGGGGESNANTGHRSSSQRRQRTTQRRPSFQNRSNTSLPSEQKSVDSFFF
jgi:hypothetical protein